MSTKSPSSNFLPETYLTSTTEIYNVYQRRYAEEPRQSDKVLLALIAEAIDPTLQSGEEIALLDIGCSTGNLLFHIKNALPDLKLIGGDLSPNAVEACRADPRLSGIGFQVMDVFELPASRFNAIVANAVNVFFSIEQYDEAIASIAKSLKPNGYYFAYEWLHSFNQDIQIVEKTRSHVDGLKFHFRPFSVVEPIFKRHGFDSVEFRPFVIPIDLERGAKYTDDDTGFEDINTYTVKTESGERLQFRGALYQPWCHLVAQMTG